MPVEDYLVFVAKTHVTLHLSSVIAGRRAGLTATDSHGWISKLEAERDGEARGVYIYMYI